MKGSDGKIYDIDFFMVPQPGKLTVTQTSVHKINGKPLYNWKQQGGVWKKCPFRRRSSQYCADYVAATKLCAVSV
ncbi:MAG: hypothetical protein DME82_12765 [Verrucomicrobia bacterium]|nr:MAG: hypothetical protein DME82_12765 [Verrucomicrobiota bacterium]